MYHALSDFYGKKIAILLHYRSEDLEPKAAIITGTAFFQDGFLRLHRGPSVPPLPIPLRMVWRAQAVTGEARAILGDVDFCIEGTPDELNLGGSFRQTA